MASPACRIRRPFLDIAFPIWNDDAMIELPDLRAFTHVAELRSVTGSARALGAPKSSVSRSLSRLEAALGSALVERSTRQLRLTDAGRLFLPHARQILSDVDEAEAAVGRFTGAPRGTLRVSAPYAFIQGTLIPMLPAFLERYPEVETVFELSTNQTELAPGEADLVIWIGPLPQTAMIVRRLASIELWTCASPAYVAARGPPSCTAELAAHDIVGIAGPHVTWSFLDAAGRTLEVRLRTRTVLPDAGLIRDAIAGGAGIGQLPDFMAATAIARGELVRILPDTRPATSDAFVLYPSHRSLSAKVRVFIDALVVQVMTRRAEFSRSVPDPACASRGR